MANEQEPTHKWPEGAPNLEGLDDTPDRIKTKKRLGCAALGVTFAVASAAMVGGAYYAANKAGDFFSSSEQVESVEVHTENAEVREIDREVAEIHSVAFTTEVNGVMVEHQLTERKTAGFIPLPDIIESVKVDGMYINSTLGLDAGDKKMTQWEEDGVSHVEYIIDPADVKVYSKVDPEHAPLVINGGNWNTSRRKGLENFKEAFPFVDEDPDDYRLSSDLKHAAEHLAIDTVNKECGPKVFDVAKDDFLQNIEDTLRRDDDEEIIVKFPDDIEATGIAISGESDIEDPLIALKDSSESGETVIINTEVGATKECVMPTEVSR